MVENHYSKVYWTESDFKLLSEATDFKELFAIAQNVLKRMPEGIGQVCGPIGTGGLGSVEANLKKFDETIRLLQSEGKIVFDQMPYEEPMQELKKKIADAHRKILEDFYLPLLESGKVKTLYFIKGWENSVGATWEHEQGKRLGLEIVYL